MIQETRDTQQEPPHMKTTQETFTQHRKRSGTKSQHVSTASCDRCDTKHKFTILVYMAKKGK
jgi:hypothetical protein